MLTSTPLNHNTICTYLWGSICMHTSIYVCECARARKHVKNEICYKYIVVKEKKNPLLIQKERKSDISWEWNEPRNWPFHSFWPTKQLKIHLESQWPFYPFQYFSNPFNWTQLCNQPGQIEWWYLLGTLSNSGISGREEKRVKNLCIKFNNHSL